MITLQCISERVVQNPDLVLPTSTNTRQKDTKDHCTLINLVLYLHFLWNEILQDTAFSTNCSLVFETCSILNPLANKRFSNDETLIDAISDLLCLNYVIEHLLREIYQRINWSPITTYANDKILLVIHSTNSLRISPVIGSAPGTALK